MGAFLKEQGLLGDRQRVRRVMQVMGLEPQYPKPQLSKPGEPSERYSSWLRGVPIERVDQVWSCDITSIRLSRGFVSLMAIIDWYSRYVVDWERSTTLDAHFCGDALDRALPGSQPEIFKTDQGVQFTCQHWIARRNQAQVRISWDGRGRALDTVFVERVWRSVK